MIRKENIVLSLEVASLLVYFAILVAGIAFAIDGRTVIITMATCYGVMAIACRILRVKWMKAVLFGW